MAEEEKTKEQPAKKFPMLMVVGLVVAGLFLAGAVSYFIATKVMADSATKIEKRDPGIFLKLGDKDGMIVNVGGVKSGRFLKVGVVLEMRAPKSEKAEEGKLSSVTETKLLDSVLQLLRSQKIEDFDPVKQEELKTQIKNEANKVLGEDCVYEVYITSFVLQ